MGDNRTWGPFTGRQLTTIIVALLVTLIPSSVWAAASFSNAAVYDPSSGKRAAVDTSRRLKVGDGGGPMTVDGLVRAQPVLSKKTFTWSDASFGAAVPAFRAGSGRVAVTDVVMSQTNGDNAAGWFELTMREDGGNGDCSTVGAVIQNVVRRAYVLVNRTFVANFTTPVVTSGAPVCLQMSTSSNNFQVFAWTITGFRT